MSWAHRRKFTSDETKVAAAYPWAMILDLSQFPADFFTKIKSDGSDIRIFKADGATELPRGVREVDTTAETGLVYFKAEGLSTSAPTEFYIYYGNAAADDYADTHALGMQAVFSTDHRGYWPLAETAGATAKDETAKDNDAVYHDDLPTPVDGAVGGAQNFDGNGDYVRGANDFQDMTAITALLWIKGGAQDNFRILSQTDFGSNLRRWQIASGWTGHSGADADKFRVVIHGDPSDGTDVREYTSETVVLDGTLHCIGFSFASGNLKLFVDGVETGVVKNTDNAITDLNSSEVDLMMGAVLSNGSPLSAYYTGLLDEPVIFERALAADEILTIYNNQFDNTAFWTVGAEEEPPDVLDAPVALAATEITANSFQANWEAVEDADEYRLDVATDEGFESILAGYDDLNVGNVTSYVVEGLDAATDYWYRLRSVKLPE